MGECYYKLYPIYEYNGYFVTAFLINSPVYDHAGLLVTGHSICMDFLHSMLFQEVDIVIIFDLLHCFTAFGVERTIFRIFCFYNAASLFGRYLDQYIGITDTGF